MSPSMSMLGDMTFSNAQRSQLAALLIDLGPNSPTLCEGWETKDLAAHLWIRENRIDAAGGMFISKLEPRLEDLTQKTLERDYEEVVKEWAAGPPKPVKFIDKQMNTSENFIHHEDVRRANGRTTPQPLSQEAQKQLYGSLKMMAPMMLKKSHSPVVLHPRGFDRIVAADKKGVARNGSDVIRVSGEVGELLLWASGRDVVDVTINGDESKIVR